MKTKLLLAASIATITAVGSATASPMTLMDENFQNGTVTGNWLGNGDLAGWTFQNNKYKVRDTGSADVPHDQDVPGTDTNKVLQQEWVGWSRFDIDHDWSADDVFTLSFNASPQAWNIHQQRYVRPKIVQDNGVVLWAPGETSETALPVFDQGVYAWNGPGPYGNSDWQSEPDLYFEFTIAASDFTAGAEGQSIYFEYSQTGQQRGSYIDNISLTVSQPSAVPSPTAALAGLIGLGGLMARRRRG